MGSKRYFITGTDTEVGKTTVTCAILESASSLGFTTLGIKPVASGCQLTPDGLRNSDALALQRASSIQLPYEQVNPVALLDSIAPDIAAKRMDVSLSRQALVRRCEKSLSYRADLTLIEGVGGWHVPLNKQETMADFVKALQLPVIMVVGMRLGCLNHAILTMQAIKAAGLACFGWVANCLDPSMHAMDENIATLKHWLQAPLLTSVNYNQLGASTFSEAIIRQLLE